MAPCPDTTRRPSTYSSRHPYTLHSTTNPIWWQTRKEGQGNLTTLCQHPRDIQTNQGGRGKAYLCCLQSQNKIHLGLMHWDCSTERWRVRSSPQLETLINHFVGVGGIKGNAIWRYKEGQNQTVCYQKPSSLLGPFYVQASSGNGSNKEPRSAPIAGEFTWAKRRPGRCRARPPKRPKSPQFATCIQTPHLCNSTCKTASLVVTYVQSGWPEASFGANSGKIISKGKGDPRTTGRRHLWCDIRASHASAQGKHKRPILQKGAVSSQKAQESRDSLIQPNLDITNTSITKFAILRTNFKLLV